MENIHLVFIGIILLVLAYLIGIKKFTWLLSGFSQHRVRDKNKLAAIVGIYDLVVGVVFIGASFIDSTNTDFLFPLLVFGYVILIIYVQRTMVE